MLEQLDHIGSFMGGIAVTVTLVYLAIQIRDNSRATRLATMQSAMVAATNVGMLAAQNRDLARIVRVGLAVPDELDEDESLQLRHYLFSTLRVYEDLFVQHAAGVIDDETWLARSKSLRTVFSTPGGLRIWESSGAYREDFRSWMDAQLRREGPPAVGRPSDRD